MLEEEKNALIERQQHLKHLEFYFHDTVKHVMEKSPCSFLCWKENDGNIHCLYGCNNACDSEPLIELLTHLITCHSKSILASKTALEITEILSKKFSDSVVQND